MKLVLRISMLIATLLKGATNTLSQSSYSKKNQGIENAIIF